ncbi:acyclic terpene utilization AtuA family protein [Saccharothrix deserti]|uniref:acyclic terpene utilization AtuA family protein n=1 Tax=Saccharothrix deserti TaxID=2593674 RepID=UPI00131C5227|nr:acyclic terpene utilization AtuA family protein [Saccharothrix deserti]
MRTTRIGCGAGFSGDRIEPAEDLLRRGDLADLVLECLGERTVAQGQRRRLADPSLGYETRLPSRFTRLLPLAFRHGVRVVTNMGAANPLAAGRLTRTLLDSLGLGGTVAVVTGDDVLAAVDLDAPAWETGRPLRSHGEIVSANAYLGADAVLPALGADVVITGRVADPSLFVAPVADRLGWDLSDVPRVAAGTLVGHLLECAGQLTGGYFADPGYQDVPDLDDLGFPYADVSADGTAGLGKLPGTGGVLSRATVREQLLYEITDPAAYRTPDVVLDLREVTVTDDVRVSGARGLPRPDELKVSVGYRAGSKVEAEISYVGPNAAARGALAAEVVTKRLAGVPLRAEVLGGDLDCRLRVAAISHDGALLDRVGDEVESLYTNGPAGGGGVRVHVTEVIGIVSTLIPREAVRPAVTLLEAADAAP